jgi:hypothetical protein
MADGYDRNVFINCPFDAAYQPIFQAMVFAVHDCGFVSRTALEVEDGGEVRIRKIKRIIGECRYGIHDISRVQLDEASGLPRFNMPLELGLFLGAQEYGSRAQKRKRSLVLDAEPYRYQTFCSDIAGQDIRSHGNDPARAVVAVRAMLATALDGDVRVPGPAVIAGRYTEFRRELPLLCAALYIHQPELQFVEFRSLAATWLSRHPVRAPAAAAAGWGAGARLAAAPYGFMPEQAPHEP